MEIEATANVTSEDDPAVPAAARALTGRKEWMELCNRNGTPTVTSSAGGDRPKTDRG